MCDRVDCSGPEKDEKYCPHEIKMFNIRSYEISRKANTRMKLLLIDSLRRHGR